MPEYVFIGLALHEAKARATSPDVITICSAVTVEPVPVLIYNLFSDEFQVLVLRWSVLIK